MPVKPLFAHRLDGSGFTVEKYLLFGEGMCVIPLIVFVPGAANKARLAQQSLPAVIIASPFGKNTGDTDIKTGWIPALSKSQNVIVAVPDLSGFGEVGEGFHGYDSYAATREAFSSFTIGRSVVGLHAGEIVRIQRFLAARTDVSKVIATIAVNELAPAVLHAAAFEPKLGNVALVNSYMSYAMVALNEFYQAPVYSMVSGVLQQYDLPDLCAYLAPRSLLIISPKTQLNTTASAAAVTESYKFPTQVYAQKGVSQALYISPGDSTPTQIQQTIVQWVASLKKANK